MHLHTTIRIILLTIVAFLANMRVNAQSHLNKKISIAANREQLGNVLNKIEKQGNFYFSYSGNAVNPDSIVSLTIQDKTVRQALDALFDGKYEYDETDKHIILKRAAAESW